MVYTDAVRDRRAWVVGVGLAVALVLASGGFLLGRLSGGTRASSVPVAAPGGGGKAPAALPAASPAPSSSRPAPPTPAATGRGLPPALAGGPSRLNPLGVPVGYPRSREGAVSACANYVSAYADVGNREPARVRALFRSIAVPAAADRLADTMISIDWENARRYDVPSVNSPQLNFNLRVVGFQVRSFTDRSAQVSVWGTVGLGRYGGTDAQAPQQGWGTDICTVQWTGNDWLLSDARDGPTGPAITDRAAEGIQRFVYVGGPSA